MTHGGRIGPMLRLYSSLPLILVVWATIFNSVLAVINGHVVALSSAAVIAGEVGVVGLSHFLALSQFRREMRIWYALIAVIVVIFLLRSLLTGEAKIMYLRDILIIPTFIVLGMTSPSNRLTYLVCLLHVIVISVMIYEIVDTPGYANLFDVQNYYVNTRGYSYDQFWNEESNLFIAATRLEDRYFMAFLGWHRLSSLFLEPVSLGNYCVFVTIYLCARFSALNVFERWFLGLGNVFLIIGCDGRFAATASLIIIPVSLVATKLPRKSAVLYLPAAVLAAIMLTVLAGLKPGADDFAGRIAYSVELLGRYDLNAFFGISDKFTLDAVDSGIDYIIVTQSLVGVSLIWCLIVFGAREDRSEQIRYTHGLCIYLALLMLVSASPFSIKTAALFWFVQGCLQRRERIDPVSLPITRSRQGHLGRLLPSGNLTTNRWPN